MGFGRGKVDAGSGGKRGHSNQHHWIFHDEIKALARKWRRLMAKEEIAAEQRVIESEAPDKEVKPPRSG